MSKIEEMAAEYEAKNEEIDDEGFTNGASLYAAFIAGARALLEAARLYAGPNPDTEDRSFLEALEELFEEPKGSQEGKE